MLFHTHHTDGLRYELECAWRGLACWHTTCDIYYTAWHCLSPSYDGFVYAWTGCYSWHSPFRILYNYISAFRSVLHYSVGFFRRLLAVFRLPIAEYRLLSVMYCLLFAVYHLLSAVCSPVVLNLFSGSYSEYMMRREEGRGWRRLNSLLVLNKAGREEYNDLLVSPGLYRWVLYTPGPGRVE